MPKIIEIEKKSKYNSCKGK